MDSEFFPSEYSNGGRQRVYRTLKVYPATSNIETLPEAFRKRLVKDGRIQDKVFNVVVIPMSHREYTLYSGARYNTENVVKILNEHIVPIEVDLKYIMKFPMLVKAIIDGVYAVSGSMIEEINKDPQKMFDILRRNRQYWSTVGSLVDQLIITNAGLETYMELENSPGGYQEKLLFASLLEKMNDVIIEERYDAARRRNWKMPIKLVPDKHFRKEYEAMTADGGMGEVFNESSKRLEDALKKDKKKADLGIKTKVRTKEENESLMD